MVESYIASSEGVALTAQGVELSRQYAALCDRKERMSNTYAGAKIARFLIDHSWVESCVLYLGASSEFDDNGNYFRSIQLSVEEVIPIADADFPAELEGAFDADWATERLEDSLQDDLCALYECFVDSCDYDDVILRISRNKIEHLLKGECISGAEVFTLLWPERIARIS